MNKKVKKIAYHLHLWLGGISGLIMFIVCITGAIWAVGIHNWFGVNPSAPKIEVVAGQELMAPSVLTEKLADTLKGAQPMFIRYERDRPAAMRVYGDEANLWITLNPYTADIISYKDYNDKSSSSSMSFWDYMRWGHRALWLPWDVGRVIVNYGTLTFLIVLVSGLILWIPKSRKGLKNRLTFNWKRGTKLKRKLYDMHLVLGFYASFFLIVICCTGMVWGLDWWSRATYKITTGDSLPPWGSVEAPKGATDLVSEMALPLKMDFLFYRAIEENPNAEAITVTYPERDNENATIGIKISHDEQVLYNYDSFYYNQHSLREVKSSSYRDGRYSDKSLGEKLRRQNYDLHIGSIWGKVGQVLMFFAALFGASLPLTGYYILFVVKRKKKKKE